jgi:hypothetical protein
MLPSDASGQRSPNGTTRTWPTESNSRRFHARLAFPSRDGPSRDPAGPDKRDSGCLGARMLIDSCQDTVGDVEAVASTGCDREFGRPSCDARIQSGTASNR